MGEKRKKAWHGYLFNGGSGYRGEGSGGGRVSFFSVAWCCLSSRVGAVRPERRADGAAPQMDGRGGRPVASALRPFLLNNSVACSGVNVIAAEIPDLVAAGGHVTCCLGPMS